VNSKKAIDSGPMFKDMADSWQRGMDALEARFKA
jgi:hypothetical protein